MLTGLQDWQWYGIINKGGFRPNRIAGLKLWLDANDPSTLFQDAAKTIPAGDGDVVGAWADKSGQGNDATQATTSSKPSVDTTGINGLTSVRGITDDVLSTTVVTTNETIFVVAEHDVNNALASVIGSAINNDRLRYNLAVNSYLYLYNGGSATLNSGPNELDPQIFRAIYDGTTRRLSITNSAEITGASAPASHTWTSVFSRGASDFMNGLIAEVLIYNTVLSAADIDLVQLYLSNKWGITIA